MCTYLCQSDRLYVHQVRTQQIDRMKYRFEASFHPKSFILLNIADHLILYLHVVNHLSGHLCDVFQLHVDELVSVPSKHALKLQSHLEWRKSKRQTE